MKNMKDFIFEYFLLTSEGAEVCHDSIRDVGDLDEGGIVGLGDEGTVGDTEAGHGDVNDVAANLHRGELDPEDSITRVHHLVRYVSFFWA